MTSSLPAEVERWRERGSALSLAGREVFFVRGGSEAEPILFLHGFPSSSFDWRELADRLEPRAWIAPDFVGFGLSEKPSEPNDLRRQAGMVEELLTSLGVDAVRIIAHDMGTSVANELMARDLEGALSFDLKAVLLFNGSMVVERASLTWEQRVLRGRAGFVLAGLSNRLSLKRGLGATFSDTHPLTDSEAECQWALLRHRAGNRKLHRAITYIDQRIELAGRWHGAIRDWPGALELAWGLGDPVATTDVLAAVRELRPQVRVHELPGLGHYPQIEDPERMAEVIARSVCA